MQGRNMFEFNQGTMQEIVAEYLNRKLFASERVEVESVREISGSQTGCFKVVVKSPESKENKNT